MAYKHHRCYCGIFIIVFIISAFAIKNTYYSNVESILNSGASSTAVSYFSANLDVGNTLEQSATEYIDSYSYKEKQPLG